ncbi:MerR family transcriptional regulator [Litchfieldia salsa]|uniref:DNA-binding transcriptional regulator, MerR family n=1 Tax=Litchfieldia salsa TaxID=930152 RepID=A0A1H0UVE2_9BACI|nr:MerR family transcriptional regulator [Litchfieldia salsa]SDP69838.1 DNA-binding transcriptional regulator, MerR family [Litchfieldia salsa]
MLSSSDNSYIHKKVISIGTVCELTGLSERQIRYYEERELIFPKRSNKGNRKYSFSDVEALMDIANKMEDGLQTSDLRKEITSKRLGEQKSESKEQMIRGQLNAYFKRRQ